MLCKKEVAVQKQWTSVVAHPVAAIPLVMQGIAQEGREPTEGVD